MTSYDGPATIQQDGRDAVVECGFAVRTPGRPRGSWSGRFEGTDLRLVTGEAMLVLPDGVSARILIDHIDFDGPSALSGTFIGVQSPPE